MTYKLLKVGSDAEMFLYKDGNPFPVFGLVGGTKQNPKPVLGGGGFAVQEDNVLLEFNIPPASTAEEFQQSITTMLAYLREEMGKQSLACSYASIAVFNKKLLDHPQANAFGCEPDYCVWTRSVNVAPTFLTFPYNSYKAEYRVAGFHIHVSYLVDDREPTLQDKEWFVKAQDIFLGVPSLYIDTGELRRNFYGRAGSFRPKEYGHEYRVLGGGFLNPSPALNQWIFKQNEKAINFLNMGAGAEHAIHEWGEMIVNAIDGHNMRRASEVMAHFNILPPPL